MNPTQFGFREDFDLYNRFMKLDHVKLDGKKYLISTVDLGLNHQFIQGGPPLYYETMIFPDDDWSALYLNRYTTEEQAIEGHGKVLQALKDGNYTMSEYGFTFEEEKIND